MDYEFDDLVLPVNRATICTTGNYRCHSAVIRLFSGYDPRHVTRGADKSLARPGRKQATETEDFDVHISYL